MEKVAIIGHTGRLGKPLFELLSKHPKAEIVYTESRSECAKGNLDDVEIVFLALPYEESKNYLPRLKGKKVIDLSIDHRDNKEWVYGLSELNKEEIKSASKIANPGCYATSIILALAPIKDKTSEINISSTSGISGAGFDIQEKDNFLIYKPGQEHPQINEIKNTLNLNEVLFVPQRIDSTDRGIISTIFAKYNGSKEDLEELYKEFYKQHKFIRIKECIETKDVIGTNFCDIKIMQFKDKVIIISALDNLIKGGAGQAVQNFNIMCGFGEGEGLLLRQSIR